MAYSDIEELGAVHFECLGACRRIYLGIWRKKWVSSENEIEEDVKRVGMEDKYIFTVALGLSVGLVDVLWRSRGTAEPGEVTDPLLSLFDGLVRM